MKSILLVGAQGRLGRIISDLLRKAGSFRVYECGSVRSALPSDLRPFLPLSDIVIDVSTRAALRENLPKITSHKKPLIIGSTGHNEQEQEAIVTAAKTIPIFLSSNFSLGISWIKQILPSLPKGAVRIHESHHLKKKDAPSGTALTLASLCKEPPEISYERVGEEIGLHQLEIKLPFETITITHQAFDRKAFGLGVIEAISFLSNKPAGLYTSVYDESV